MSAGKFATFLATVLAVWALMHVYVFWRLSSVPWVAGHVPRRVLIFSAALLWLSYPAVRMLEGLKLGSVLLPLEYFGSNWIGFVFLLVAGFFAADILTLGGWLFPRWTGAVRGGFAVLAMVLGLVALAQAARAPVVREAEVLMTGLPRERDGLVIVQLTDLHLGSLLGPRWLARQVERVEGLKPDLVVVVGDTVDGDVPKVEPCAPWLGKLKAPLGVLAVTGNHEFYAGVERSVALMERAGWTVLRDRALEVAPGLVVAGVDDLTARRQFGASGDPLGETLAQRPPGATVLLSHTPWQAQSAAAAGVGLMLSGHTHEGQIWPFNYLVRTRYPFIGGRQDIGGMTLIVCRGTGTWGPRMRLWRPSEIVRITLRAA